jgi:hypothetical protein
MQIRMQHFEGIRNFAMEWTLSTPYGIKCQKVVTLLTANHEGASDMKITTIGSALAKIICRC